MRQQPHQQTRRLLVRRFLQARIDVRDAEKQYMDERMPADKIIIRKKDEEAERAWLEKLKRDDWDLK